MIIGTSSTDSCMKNSSSSNEQSSSGTHSPHSDPSQGYGGIQGSGGKHMQGHNYHQYPPGKYAINFLIATSLHTLSPLSIIILFLTDYYTALTYKSSNQLVRVPSSTARASTACTTRTTIDGLRWKRRRWRQQQCSSWWRMLCSRKSSVESEELEIWIRNVNASEVSRWELSGICARCQTVDSKNMILYKSN